MPHFYSVWNICMWLHSLSKNANEFCLLATELANTKWESLCQLFADVFDLLLIHLQDVPPVRNSGMEHSFMRFVFFFSPFSFPLLVEVLTLITSYCIYLKYATGAFASVPSHIDWLCPWISCEFLDYFILP